MDRVAAQIQSAFATKDLDALGRLLAPDARWGDDDHPNIVSDGVVTEIHRDDDRRSAVAALG
jgi:hypothetical protein